MDLAAAAASAPPAQASLEEAPDANSARNVRTTAASSSGSTPVVKLIDAETYVWPSLDVPPSYTVEAGTTEAERRLKRLADTPGTLDASEKSS